MSGWGYIYIYGFLTFIQNQMIRVFISFINHFVTIYFYRTWGYLSGRWYSFCFASDVSCDFSVWCLGIIILATLVSVPCDYKIASRCMRYASSVLAVIDLLFGQQCTCVLSLGLPSMAINWLGNSIAGGTTCGLDTKEKVQRNKIWF